MTNLFESFSCSLNIWDHNGKVPVGVVVVVCLSGGIIVIGVLIGLVVPFKFMLELV